MSYSLYTLFDTTKNYLKLIYRWPRTMTSYAGYTSSSGSHTIKYVDTGYTPLVMVYYEKNGRKYMCTRDSTLSTDIYSMSSSVYIDPATQASKVGLMVYDTSAAPYDSVFNLEIFVFDKGLDTL